MSASQSEPMGARGWEPDFTTLTKLDLEKEARSIHNAIWNAWRQGRDVPRETINELHDIEAKIKEL